MTHSNAIFQRRRYSPWKLLVTGNDYGILQEKDVQIKWGPDSGLTSDGSEYWDSRAEHISCHTTCYMTDTRNSAMALVPWLYPNSPPSDDPGITTKSSPFLLASQQYLARVPSSPDQPASSPCPGMAWYIVGTQPKIAWWMTVFQVGPLPSMSHFSHRNDDSIAYTEQTMPKQKGRKTSEPSSLLDTAACDTVG